MDLNDAKRLMPLTAHPIELNPAPDAHSTIERQFARIERLRSFIAAATDEIALRILREELAACEARLARARRTLIGRWRIFIIGRRYKWR